MSRVKTKSKFELVRQSYQDMGVKGAIINTWKYLFQHSPFSSHLEMLLGETYHQKLLAFPALGYWPKIQNPRSVNEKIINRKLYTNNDVFSTVADKYAVREYVSEKVGGHILTDVYHVTDNPESIPFKGLPDQFVIKPTHSCGNVIVVDDKEDVQYSDIISQCETWLDIQYGENTKEYWYSDIPPKIIVEEYINENGRRAPLDYKFFVFGGEPKCIQVDYGRFSQHKMSIYNDEWELMDFKKGYQRAPDIDEPYNLEEMVDIAATLGKEFGFVRVDLYNPRDGVIRFGEMTLAPGGGLSRFDPVQADFELGSYWTLGDNC
ncbi:hypothetical protein C482_20191 [Natrialba chahannaoensis JCM 10990]|uniref:TupA-like ATPgrasp n=1 Tax=Natrialba chahannaoensis JCM 10990 TaxID=1227492 RepID=M0A3Y9_9EURY|nr:ATP-grasp fold amidoligase family protein [Natrialba chahannaoensis]ELY93031.1 hypothetical protein C482_20191 [Natrialba chahannaoensis JCM 10990]